MDSCHARLYPTVSLLPLVGLGTWTQRRKNEIRDAVLAALRLGYRHLDCAAEYGNEGEVGEALRLALQQGLVRREELWVTTKLNTHGDEGRVEEACRESLTRLGLEYVDLYLVHWPATDHKGPTVQPPLEEIWREMEGLVRKGLTRAIGVSNFSVRKLQAILDKATIKPAVNQVEAHPYFRNGELLDWCRSKGIHVTAYSPLGTPHTASFFKRKPAELLKDPVVLGVAQKLGRSPGEVVLRWGVQRGTSVIPKSTQEAHLAANLGVLRWELTPEDFEALSTLATQCRMVDGSWWLSKEGPYLTLQDLWDRPDEKQTRNTAAEG